jgi:hypothetical protein
MEDLMETTGAWMRGLVTIVSGPKGFQELCVAESAPFWIIEKTQV